jgi:hypothetical protein
MNDDFLKVRLQRVVRRYQWLALWRKLAVCWALAALVSLAVAWIQNAMGAVSPLTMLVLIAVMAGALVVVISFHFLQRPDLRWIARKIETKHPELNGILLTAVQQQVDSSQPQGYLQYRVLQEATAKSQEQDWRDIVPASRLLLVHGVHVVAFACFIFALANLRVTTIHGEKPSWVGTDGISVTPGDAKVERGDSLVVLARFGGALPPNVNLVMRESGSAQKNIPLVKSLADPVFGGSVTEVTNDFTYHLEYRGQKTRDFKVTVFEHPRLVRSDVDLKFPDYTKLAPKHIEDTRRVSAVEGTKLDFALQLNKPVQSAKLIARDSKKTEIPLTVSPDKATATLPAFVPTKSQSYDLQLVDAEGRKNKVASPFVIDVQPNRPPELRLASPRGDVRPSALEEVAFDGTVFDDFGTPAYGLAYTLAGGEAKFIELGKDGAAKEKRSFAHLLNLEELGAKPDDLVSWYAWADDIGPDGNVRRTNGDLYFAEVRPFDEIFRESQNMESGEQEGGGQGQEARKLTELQKQIINATWKLQREGMKPKYAEDAKVVLEAQEQALAQAQESAEEARSPRQQAMWKSVTQEMDKAIEKLKDSAKTPDKLPEALATEQAAYAALLKLQARETAVTRKNSKKGGGGGGQQGNQRQIDQLDLKQAENRYETQRQAKSPQNQERREQLAVMNRLQELARRQQDLNERLKELQTALQEAQTEQQKEEIKRRLKRLEEEQRQMLADADEVRQRMDRAENQSTMAEQRQQLDQTREDIQKAADSAAQGSVAQALAAGTRAQRQLQEMRDEMRKENSSQFAEDLREMRNEARELSREQEELTKKIDALANGTGQAQQRKSLSDSEDRKEMLDKLSEQRDRMNKLVDQATQISEQAENTEPLLSRQLYDSVRKISQDDNNTLKQARSDLMNGGRMTRDLYERLQKSAESDQGGKVLDLTREMLREGYLPQARQAGQSARSEIEELRRGVERAAESVLGDDAEQLKLAQSELDSLTDQLQREIAQAGAAQKGGAQDGQQPGQSSRKQGDQRQAGNQSDPNAPSPGNEPGEGNQPGQSGQQQGDQQARADQEGRGQGEGTRDGQGQRPGQRGDPSRQVANNEQRGQQGQGQQPGGEPGQQPGGEQPGGQQPGGQAPSEQQTAQAGGQQGQGQQGQQGQGQQAGQGQQGGGQGGQQEARDSNDQPGQRNRGQLAEGRDPRNPRSGPQRGGGGGGGSNRGVFDLETMLNVGTDRTGGLGGWNGGRVNAGPLTGEDFNRWAERLRDVEELVETPEMRNALAAARERARTLRRDFRQDQKKPDWTVVQLEIVKPLVEVRNRVAEELARRDSKDSLAPIDRDPVPTRFAESVRRYYEELGKDK